MPQVQGQRDRAPGVIYPIVTLNPATFQNTRVAPSIYQHAEQGTLWIQPRDNSGAFVGNGFINVGNLNGQAQWAQIADIGGALTGTSLTITPGPISLTGTTNINFDGAAATNIGTGTNTGLVTIGNTANGAGVDIFSPATDIDGPAAGTIAIGDSITTGSITIGDGLTTGSIQIGNHTSSNTVDIESGTGGVNIISGGLMSMDFLTDIVASPTATAVINGRQCYASYTGFTTAAAASQVFIITNSIITAGSSIIVTANNLGSNDAQMTVTRVLPGAGTVSITLKNNGAAALNGQVNITMLVLD